MIGFVWVLLVVAVVLLVLNGALQWPGSRAGSLRADPEVTVRLARIENTLRLLESRLDGVEEQQQFLERLLSDRADSRALPAPDRPVDSDDPTSILFDLEAADSRDAEAEAEAEAEAGDADARTPPTAEDR